MELVVIAAETDLIEVNGHRIHGWTNNDTCPFCGQQTVVYLLGLDAEVCPDCNRWLEKTCSDPNCWFCHDRPERPLPLRVSKPREVTQEERERNAEANAELVRLLVEFQQQKNQGEGNA